MIRARRSSSLANPERTDVVNQDTKVVSAGAIALKHLVMDKRVPFGYSVMRGVDLMVRWSVVEIVCWDCEFCVNWRLALFYASDGL